MTVAAAAASAHVATGGTSFTDQIVILVVGAVLGSFFWSVAKAAGVRFGGRVEQPKQTAADVSDMGDFFFDQPGNPRLGTKGTQGWTTVVDAQLEDHGRQLSHVTTLVEDKLLPKVERIFDEVIPDGNGNDNLRGVVTTAAEAAVTAAERVEARAEAEDERREKR